MMRWSLSGALFAIWTLLFGLACLDVVLDGGKNFPYAAAVLYGAACLACTAGAHHFLTRSRRQTRSS